MQVCIMLNKHRREKRSFLLFQLTYDLNLANNGYSLSQEIKQKDVLSVTAGV